MRKKILICLLLIISVSMAQRPPGNRDFDPKTMEAVRIWKLTEVLELTEEQVTTFLPLVQIHERKLREVQKEIIVLGKEGKLLLKTDSKVSQKDVDKFIKEYSAKQDEIHKIKHDFLKSLPKHLTPEQQLLYLGFESHFRSELRDFMKKERRSKTDQKRRSSRP